MKKIDYEEIKLLKQSEKSKVLLVRDGGGERVFIKKVLYGKHPIYTELLHCSHPFLPKLYDVILSNDATIIIEEYVEGTLLGSVKLSEKQIVNAVRELCSVLEYLHGKDIIHRDIKPSNIILAEDGHIRLLDFDAARMPKDDLEQDTRLLGTRGYAPPEQYGFAQTDARADIYSLGITLKRLLGEKAHKPHYRRIIRKCTNLNPDNRYQSALQIKWAFFCRERCILYSVIGFFLFAVLWYAVPSYHPVQQEEVQALGTVLTILPAPDNPRWDKETGIAEWGNVPDSGSDGVLVYRVRLYYRKDTANPPNVNEDLWDNEQTVRCGWDSKQALSVYRYNLGYKLLENGYYYFAVSAVGDDVQYEDSPYVLASNVFHYTGEDAPPLPMPTGLAWNLVEEKEQQRFATWSNLEDYENTDSFNVSVYNQDGIRISNNIWSKQDILTIGHGGIWFDNEFFSEEDDAFRFTVQVQTSRPNEYRSSSMPDPVPEEYFSPWLYPSQGKK